MLADKNNLSLNNYLDVCELSEEQKAQAIALYDKEVKSFTEDSLLTTEYACAVFYGVNLEKDLELNRLTTKIIKENGGEGYVHLEVMKNTALNSYEIEGYMTFKSPKDFRDIDAM